MSETFPLSTVTCTITRTGRCKLLHNIEVSSAHKHANYHNTDTSTRTHTTVRNLPPIEPLSMYHPKTKQVRVLSVLNTCQGILYAERHEDAPRLHDMYEYVNCDMHTNPYITHVCFCVLCMYTSVNTRTYVILLSHSVYIHTYVYLQVHIHMHTSKI